MKILVKTRPKYQKNRKATNWPYGNIIFHEPGVLSSRTTNVDLVPPWLLFFKTSYGTKLKKKISKIIEVESDIYWPDMIYIEDKYSANTRSIFEYNWLRRYLSPEKWFHDNGSEFTVWELQSLLDTNEIATKNTTVNKPRDNKIVWTINLTMVDMTGKANLKGLYWKQKITTLLQAVYWDLRETVHTTDGY